jgi:hypothetical protein
LKLELNIEIPIRPLKKLDDDLMVSDSPNGTPQRMFVNREAEIELALKTFHDSHRPIDKVS